jgi:hypothetical protein
MELRWEKLDTWILPDERLDEEESRELLIRKPNPHLTLSGEKLRQIESWQFFRDLHDLVCTLPWAGRYKICSHPDPDLLILQVETFGGFIAARTLSRHQMEQFISREQGLSDIIGGLNRAMRNGVRSHFRTGGKA